MQSGAGRDDRKIRGATLMMMVIKKMMVPLEIHMTVVHAVDVSRRMSVEKDDDNDVGKLLVFCLVNQYNYLLDI